MKHITKQKTLIRFSIFFTIANKSFEEGKNSLNPSKRVLVNMNYCEMGRASFSKENRIVIELYGFFVKSTFILT